MHQVFIFLSFLGLMQVGGPYWHVPLGRKDSKTAGFALSDSNLPTADDSLISIISKFIYQGLSVTDMVALSGKHEIIPSFIQD